MSRRGGVSCGGLEHFGICSPRGAGRSQGYFHLESGAIHFTVSKSQALIQGALDGEMPKSPDPHLTVCAEQELLGPSPLVQAVYPCLSEDLDT